MIKRIPSVLIALVVVGCWLGCADETEAHEGADAQSCVTCCANHQLLPTSFRTSMTVPDGFLASGVSMATDLYDQVVVRLLDPPPKFAA